MKSKIEQKVNSSEWLLTDRATGTNVPPFKMKI